MASKELTYPKSDYYVGIDPGFSGGIVSMNAKGEIDSYHEMPVFKHKEQTEVNAHKLAFILTRYVTNYSGILVGVEWNSPRAFQNAASQWKFALQHGEIQAILDEHEANWVRIPPQLWKGRLGLPGKVDDPKSEAATAYFLKHYPDYGKLIRKPRGGLHDGILDAALIAHFLRIHAQ